MGSDNCSGLRQQQLLALLLRPMAHLCVCFSGHPKVKHIPDVPIAGSAAWIALCFYHQDW